MERTVSTKRKLGYVVATELGVLWEENRASVREGQGVLFHGSAITVFATRSQAKAAIVRTRRYASEHKLPWGDLYWTKAVEAHT